MTADTITTITVATGLIITIAVLGLIARVLLRGGAQFGDAVVRARLVRVDADGVQNLFAEIVVDNQNDSSATVSAQVRATSPLTAPFEVARIRRTGPAALGASGGFETFGEIRGRAQQTYLLPVRAARPRAVRISVNIRQVGNRTQHLSMTRVVRPTRAARRAPAAAACAQSSQLLPAK